MIVAGPPRLRIGPVDVARREGDAWRITLSVTCNEPLGIEILSVIAPHAKFRSDETSLALRLGEGATSLIAVRVRVDGAPGGTIENAFLILVVRHAGQRWRFLARIRVTLDHDGRPHPRRETITTQRVGSAAES
ncbi:MAG TPA: hypothetical protein VGQ86_05960 [Candidatus Limnocylindria bacterium]|nr:hypothetical protein [Candidatus Limnocylindria bacterium]